MKPNEQENARSLAARLLTKIEKDKAYANLLLRRGLPCLSDPRDRQLCTALVNGVLKNRSTLDFVLRRHLRKPVSNLPLEVRQILRIGAFQLLYTDRIPAAAAVDESVKLARRVSARVSPDHSEPKYAGLVNAVLRRVAVDGWDFAWPDARKDPAGALATRYSHPQWLVQAWIDRWGAAETEALCAANNETAGLCLRANTLLTSREAVKQELEDRGLGPIELCSWAPDGLYVIEPGVAIEQEPAYREGRVTVQDESSQLAAWLLDARPSQRVLDVCSAPGGKTGYLAQQMRNQGELWAVDILPERLELVRATCARLHLDIVHPRLGNAQVLFGVPGLFERVLVDAPCSGLGVIRRRADLRWQKDPEQLRALPALQLAILNRAADFVQQGGILLYATCTVEPAENFEVVKAFRAARPEFEPLDLTPELSSRVAASGLESLVGPEDLKQWKKGMWQILPHRHKMDGFFVGRLRRT